MEVGWLPIVTRRPATRYTMQVTVQDTEAASSSGSVWLIEPAAPIHH